MKYNTKIIFLIVVLLMLLIIPSIVNASDTQYTQTTINNVTVNWTYKLNESNQIEKLKCTNPNALTGNITIPSTLDGKTVVAIGNEAFKSATGITGVIIPTTIKTLEYSAFEGCINLSSVNLGSIETISFDAFKGCKSLKSIKIPKSLKNGSISPMFTDCINLTSITFEEGLTVIPQYLCATTGITEVTIPSTVKEIGHNAFEGCINLSSVNLGSIETISFDAFKGCKSLKSIKIPKSLKNGSISPIFTNCTNLTSITFEEGLTVIPQYLCATTGITEITVPNTVKEIGNNAFTDCKGLKKITILDNVTKLGFFSMEPKNDSVFKNHNNDLTIYCYEGSTAAKYAINNNIKYVYLIKDSTNNQGGDKIDGGSSVNGNNNATQKEDPTTSPNILPNTGITKVVIFMVFIILVVGVISFKKYNNYRDIK